MKKTAFALAFISIFNLQFSIAHAQEDIYVIEQAFPVAISQLAVVEGWTLHLVYTPGEDSTRVAVVTPCPYYFAEGKDPSFVKLDGEKLHIGTNRTMPSGTLVEVRYPEPLDAVIATGNVKLDTLHMLLRSQGPRAAAIMVAGRNSRLRIDCLVAEGDIGVDCSDEGSRVEIGTVRCRQFLVDEHKQECVKVERLEADSLVVVPHHWWHDINYANTLLIGGKAGAASLMGKNTPYSTSFALSVDFFVRIMEAPLSRRWTLSTGIGFGLDEQVLSYDVLLEDGQIIFNPNHTVDHPISVLMQNYLSLPLRLQFRPKGRWAGLLSNHMDLCLEPRFSIWGGVAGWRNGETYTDMTDLFSRFQLRLSFSNTLLASKAYNIISSGITWEVFVDLLPTYRPSAGARGLHQIGIAVHF